MQDIDSLMAQYLNAFANSFPPQPPQPVLNCAPQIVHAVVTILSLTFSANHPVENDTLGNFAAPEWSLTRVPQDYPVCYTRNRNIQLTAVFRVDTHPTATEAVQIRGRAAFLASNLEWTATVNVNPGDVQVTTPLMTSNLTLPNEVACFDANNITWEMNPAATGWAGAGTTNNIIYVTLGDPNGTPDYWTLLDISCRAASTSTTADQVVTRSFQPFTGRNLTRKRDNHALTYWNPNTTTATTTRGMLAAADGSGQCGAWAQFLIDMFKAHGITTADRVEVVRSIPERNNVGFLVKNWNFNTPPATSANSFTHLDAQMTKMPGIPGQSNPNPPPAFFNHFIVVYNLALYDPSYGAGPFNNQLLSWEDAAIDGLFQSLPRMNGYNRVLVTLAMLPNLLELWNLRTHTRI